MLVIKNWQYWVWPTFPTSKPSKSAFAFHEEKKHLLRFPHSFLRTFKYHLAAAFTEPGRISGISFRKIACALQSAGLYIGRAEQRATSENARRSRGRTAPAASSHPPAGSLWWRHITFRFSGSGKLECPFLEVGDHVAVCSSRAC